MENINFKLTLKFDHPVKVYGLVIGGLLPLSFVPSGVVLIDRNILSDISSVSEHSKRNDSVVNSWWIKFLNNSQCKINPVLCATEGNSRTVPSYYEYKKSYNEACTHIKKYLPLASLITFTEQQFRYCYQIIENTHERYLNEIAFLVEVSPLLVDRKSDQELRKVEKDLFSICRKNKLDVYSLPLLIALSCLYESKQGNEPLIGRKVLKPSLNYCNKDAHNTVSDLRALENLALSNGLGLGNLTFCTRDKHLAALWCSLDFSRVTWHSGSSGDVSLNLELKNDLFPRLKEHEIVELRSRIENNRF